MVYCQECGANVSEDMAFCPKCGAPLKAGTPEAPSRRDWRRERRERRRDEKGEKNEKGEKYEVGGLPIGPIIGGLVLILIGVSSALSILGYRAWDLTWPIFIIAIGLFIIISAYMRTVRRRNPPT